MVKCRGEYRPLLVESFDGTRPGHRYPVEVRPLPGQGFSTDLLVECPMSMRTDHPIGTVFRICAKLKDTPFDTKHLYTYKYWPYDVVPPDELV